MPSGARALAAVIVGQQCFDAIIVNSDLKDISGFDFVSALSAREDLRSIITMLIGSHKPADNIARCRNLGLAGYAFKPLSSVDLLNIVCKSVGEVSESHAVENEFFVKPPNIKSLSILLTEDNLANQKLATHVLQKIGHRVTLANNGLEAVQMVRKELYDLVLMDVQMPVLSGIDATKFIRKLERTTKRHQLILAMTANAMEGDRERCLAAGMDGYISKPIRKSALLEEIGRVLEMGRTKKIINSAFQTIPGPLN